MSYTVTSFDEMPSALSYLINKVESLQKTVNALQNKQQSTDTPTWMNIDELITYHPNHPKKQTIYEWVSKKKIPVHKTTKGLMFLKSEIDDFLMQGAQKSQEKLEREARELVNSWKKPQL